MVLDHASVSAVPAERSTHYQVMSQISFISLSADTGFSCTVTPVLLQPRRQASSSVVQNLSALLERQYLILDGVA